MRSTLLPLSALLLLLPSCDSDPSSPDEATAAAKADSVTVSAVKLTTPDAQEDDAQGADPTSGTGYGDAGSVNQLPGFDMDIEMTETDISLAWEDMGTTYSVWRSTEAYFVPGDDGSVEIATNVATNAYTDVGGAADDTSYYYRVVASDGARSTTCGKYVHTIRSRWNKVSQPLLTGITSGIEFVETFEEGTVNRFPYLFDASTQRYVRAGKYNDYAFGPAQCPIVYGRPASGGEFKHKVVGHVPDYGEMGLPLYAGHNYVTLPLWYGSMTASELLELLPEDAAVAGFGPWGLTPPYSASGGNDFTIDPGACIAITMTGDAQWPPPQDAKEVLSTDWEGGIPEEFEAYNSDQCNYYVEDGSLVLEPAGNTVWFGNNSAFQLGQPISGDFCVTAHMAVTNLDGTSVSEGERFRIGGIMVRDPESADPNTYHCGFGNGGGDVTQFEFKSTVSGVSELEFSDFESGEGEIRICRVGTTVQSLLKQPEGDWQVMDSRERADLPEVLECGPIAYSTASPADFRATCDYLNVKSVSSLEDCLVD